MALLDRAVVRLLPVVPKPVIRRISARYIAGTEVRDACRVVTRLNADGKTATVDVLGEEITSADEARAITGAYVDVLAAIEGEGLDANVSVKPTALGLKLATELCRENLVAIVHDAAARERFVRIDMEDASTVDGTLAVYRDLRSDGHDNVGIVLQSSLRRALGDARELLDLRPNVRVCKGIYVEDEAIQYHDPDEVRRQFVRIVEVLVDGGCKVAVATHDDELVAEGKRIVAERELTPSQYEFQLLLGVRPELGDRLVAEGHRLRIYVPFGRQWYEYSLRRLQENPRIAGYVAADTFGRLLPGRRNGRAA